MFILVASLNHLACLATSHLYLCTRYPCTPGTAPLNHLPSVVLPSKTLPLHLRLGRRDRCRGIRINEPAPVLAVLELGGLG